MASRPAGEGNFVGAPRLGYEITMIDGQERGRITALIDFWFGAPRSEERFSPHPEWFKADPAYDGRLRERFLADQHRAAAGLCDHWISEAEPCLALILLLDQLPRNLFRGTPEAFASDSQARAAARQALRQGFDRSLPQTWRGFIYLPFEHSETLADQELAVRLFAALPGNPDSEILLDYAKRHRDIVARFGRFPHRNHILGRVSSAAEAAFLAEPGSSF